MRRAASQKAVDQLMAVEAKTDQVLNGMVRLGEVLVVNRDSCFLVRSVANDAARSVSLPCIESALSVPTANRAQPLSAIRFSLVRPNSLRTRVCLVLTVCLDSLRAVHGTKGAGGPLHALVAGHAQSLLLLVCAPLLDTLALDLKTALAALAPRSGVRCTV